MRKLILLIVAFASSADSAVAQQRKQPTRKKLKEVKIYLRLISHYDAEKYRDGLFPVKRLVDGRAQLHNALEIFTFGPTSREKNADLAESHFELEFNCVTLKANGEVMVRFSQPYLVDLPYDEKRKVNFVVPASA